MTKRKDTEFLPAGYGLIRLHKGVPANPARRKLLGQMTALAAAPLVVACGGGDTDSPAAAIAAAAPKASSKADLPGIARTAPIAANASQNLFYQTAGSDWASTWLPIGNGRAGAMLAGGVLLEQMQFNELSLWAGTNNFDGGAYDISGFGSYQNFGSLSLSFGASLPPAITSPNVSASASSAGEGVLSTVDGNLSTKWCIVSPPNLVTWQAALSAAAVVSAYTLTSANDVPARDPLQWVVSGSNNGSSWTVLDSQNFTATPFAGRGQTNSYAFSNSTAFRYYKIDFAVSAAALNEGHFQIAEIGLNGVNLSQNPSTQPLYVFSPSGHGMGALTSSSSQRIDSSVDGNANTKWCVFVNPGDIVQWQIDLGAAQAISSYALTSANDVPARDPQAWTLAGSNDGVSWTQMDSQSSAPFASRGLQKTFALAGSTGYRYWRFNFDTSKCPADAGSGDPKTGHFQLAEIVLSSATFTTAGKAVACEYQRRLNLQNGLQTTSYLYNGNYIIRETFASKVDNVIVMQLRSEHPGGLSGLLQLTSGQSGDAITALVSASEESLSFSSSLANNALNYAAKIRLIRTNGSAAQSGAGIQFSACDSILLLLDARTNYAPSYSGGWRGSSVPLTVVNSTLSAAAAQSFAAMYASHYSDFQPLMTAVDANWGNSSATLTSLPTDLRLSAYQSAAGGKDPTLEQSRFHLGRYLLASCSRKGGLPANLQGLWNNSNNPPWFSDYHNDINIQMCYWSAESTALPDCHLPLSDFIVNQAPALRVATQANFPGSSGWAARTSQSIFGGSSWEYFTPTNAWYMQHMWEHYAFSQDMNYLQTVAYPMIKEVAQFWTSGGQLVKNSAGQYLVAANPKNAKVSNSGSPEQGPAEDGVMFGQELVWDVFQNFQKATSALTNAGLTPAGDSALLATVQAMQAKLAPNLIGAKGQLQEFQEDYESNATLEANKGLSLTHRHTSHLIALYPGSQITPSATPALAQAAKVALLARCGLPLGTASGQVVAADVSSDSAASWPWTWRCALFARLADAENALVMIQGSLQRNTMPNLFTAMMPETFQIDGDLGMPGAMTEMLLQSHEGVIVLLPACPAAWQAAGSFTGLRARGGYKVSCAWSNGSVTSYSIIADKAPNKAAVKVKVNGVVSSIVPA
ncbi:glycosyl hydrolase [Collimonas pratensis]|uniref:glycosyl hydrolase family 95 catalytic domain-containing protein n=1 Tax=Collimonas pratensis TaxID=279113 RepID=UPI00143DEA4C|nr:glycoside hydrolase N-terminal domain-containing protein [Collimonas pratensis]NKI68496.1 glycosyl hydrolase [Collimonas pratensis]